MSFDHDYTGTKESGFPPIPDGDYLLKVWEVEEKKSKLNLPMVKVQLRVKEGEYANRVVWHNVTFIPAGDSGAGMSMRWLHGLGEPHTGKCRIDPDNWIGRIVKCSIITEEYKGNKNNKIKDVFVDDEGDDSTDDMTPSVVDAIKAKSQKAEISDDVPF